jgi:hypothetical protein
MRLKAQAFWHLLYQMTLHDNSTLGFDISSINQALDESQWKVNGKSSVSGLHPMTPSKIQLRIFGYRQSALSESGTIFATLSVPSKLCLSLQLIDKSLISLNFLPMAFSHK